MKDIILLFKENVLGAFTVEPDKFTVSTDGFEGSIKITDQYFVECEKNDDFGSSIDLIFGYRKLHDGSKVIAVMPHHFGRLAEMHKKTFIGFHLDKPQVSEEDPFFDQWYSRYIEGDWSIENGLLMQISFH
jgi:hypothetical protein